MRAVVVLLPRRGNERVARKDLQRLSAGALLPRGKVRGGFIFVVTQPRGVREELTTGKGLERVRELGQVSAEGRIEAERALLYQA